MASFDVLVGDCRDRLKTLPDQHFHTCVTSPPYFGLRDYGEDDQIGLEATPDEFVEAMVEVFREIRRVLRDDGTVWLNLGDSYAGSGKGRMGDGSAPDSPGSKQETNTGSIIGTLKRNMTPNCKPKDLIGIPWRVAFALQADGWYLRQDIIWCKPNPMPEPVRDRCTKNHEYIFLLSKKPTYYFDAQAIRTPVKPGSVYRANRGGFKSDHPSAGNGEAGIDVESLKGRFVDVERGANKRSVWTVTTKSFKGAHFATYPPDLIEPCVLAGCPPEGHVLDPFGGSGTTAGVAVANGRNATVIELNPEYAELIPKRVSSIVGYEIAEGEAVVQKTDFGSWFD